MTFIMQYVYCNTVLDMKSDDLRECDGACIAGLRLLMLKLYCFQYNDRLCLYLKNRDFLVSDMRDWMQEITGIQLTDQVDATCSVYSSTGKHFDRW